MALSILGVRQATCSPSTRVTATTRSGISAPRAEFQSHLSGFTQDWKRFAAARGVPKVTLHALRHSHASAIIASGTDIVTVSRRLGHASPTITMAVYAHLFDRSDDGA